MGGQRHDDRKEKEWQPPSHPSIVIVFEMHARSIVRELTALSFRSAKPVQRVGALYHKNKINPSFSEINVDTVRQFIEETQNSENLTLPFNFTEPESVKFVTQILDFSYMHGMLVDKIRH